MRHELMVVLGIVLIAVCGALIAGGGIIILKLLKFRK
jgi:hypothetical protein